MNCLVTYGYRGHTSNIIIHDVTESDWFDTFKSKCTYDKIISHVFIEQNTKIKMDCVIMYMYRGCQSSCIIHEATDDDWFDKFRSQYNYENIISHTFIK